MILIFSNTKTCLLRYCSKWIEVDKLDDLSSKNAISYLKSQLARHGIPDELRSDNGPQFRSAEFTEFSRQYELFTPLLTEILTTNKQIENNLVMSNSKNTKVPE